MPETDLENFIRRVTSDLPDMDQEDRERILALVPALFKKGFAIADARRYIRSFEEVNPELDEDVALKRMALLREKYGYRNPELDEDVALKRMALLREKYGYRPNG